jgi:geranylgeranyl reductase family protein
MSQHVAIIGGGPAGATAAEHLAHAGARVTIYEDRPGWEKPCGGGLPFRAVQRYPFLAEAPAEHKAVHRAELVASNEDILHIELNRPLLIYSRSVLNQLLLHRAQQAGAQLIKDHIGGFSRQGARWKLQGRMAEYHADYLVLAAGARSPLRAQLATPFAYRDFMLTLGYYVPACDDVLRIQFFEGFEGYAWSFPRTDHLDVGICGKTGDNMAGLRLRLRRFVRSLGYSLPCEAAPVFSHLLPALTAESWNNLRLAGPGWALIGDAAGLVDPVTGEGIYFAMRSGELLAQALVSNAPEAYPERVWDEFGCRLALGARLARLFYREDFLGQPSTTRLVQFGTGSRTFLRLVQDLLEGSQSYAGLAGRLYRILGRTFIEFAAHAAMRRAGLRNTTAWP